MAEKEATKTTTISSASSTAHMPGGGGGGASSAHAPSIRLFGTRITAMPTVEKAEETETTEKPQAPSGLTCPRCSSKETKFCYFNNYNVNQPRYYCRGCQRYWTAGGALRNVPIGAGRRKGRSPPRTDPPPFSLDGASVVQHLLFPSKRHNTGGIH